MAKSNKKHQTDAEIALDEGIRLIYKNPVFASMRINFHEKNWKVGTESAAKVCANGRVYLNSNCERTPKEWVYIIAHCQFHLIFGHFDKEKVPGKGNREFNKKVWNQACDIYIARFLSEAKIGTAPFELNGNKVPRNLETEEEIYEYLIENPLGEGQLGVAGKSYMDMEWDKNPTTYSRSDSYRESFNRAVTYSIYRTIAQISGNGETRKSPALDAAKWFMDHYPLLGGIASSFKIIEDGQYCLKHQIQVAAVNVTMGEIYINPTMKFSNEEWRFILAHEFLHAGLNHHSRCENRNPVIWNIACDFVINEWLVELGVGMIPECGVLYDPELKNLSAETIYDMLMENVKKSMKCTTFRGYGLGDMIDNPQNATAVVNFEESCKEALALGLEYHQDQGRGLIPQGLVEEIRALAVPPIPWDVKLAEWFQEHFPLNEKRYSYARPSRRQGATPDIPRPRCIANNESFQQTFAVIVDTSGSMSSEMIGIALGAIASFADSRGVKQVRVIFCDAAAYDAGYMETTEIAGTVEIKGRGGTELQPAIDLLEKSKDFPKDGPILIITDGWIESKLEIHREHAYLIPKGNRLPFRTDAKLFYYS